MTKEEIAANNARVERQVNVVLWIINVVLMLSAATFAVAFIVNVFRGNWPYAAGFALLASAVWFVFRHVPWPETEEQRKRKELASLLAQFRH